MWGGICVKNFKIPNLKGGYNNATFKTKTKIYGNPNCNYLPSIKTWKSMVHICSHQKMTICDTQKPQGYKNCML